MRTEDLNLADREDDVGPGDHEGDVAARGVLGWAGDQDGVAFLLKSWQPVTEGVVLVAGGVSNTDLHIADGKIITAPRGYTNMFHSLEYTDGGEFYIHCVVCEMEIVKLKDTLEIFLCLHIARSQQLPYGFKLNRCMLGLI